ncbi:MAG: hypothetical protein AAGB19_02820 [Cyanobacteria bacterium P01_F01_bin.3]
MLSTNNNNPLNRLPEPIVSALVAFGMAVGIGIGVGFYNSMTSSPPAEAITEAQYEKIQPGMTLTDVRAIAGDGVEVLRSESSTVFEWLSADGRPVTVIFEDGKLVEKGKSMQRR